MNRMLKNQALKLPEGTVVRGKWHHGRYRILRLLGSGTTGNVYLAQTPSGRVALKIGHESMSITSEVNVLRKFSRVQGHVLGPYLIDVDDWPVIGGSHPYYAMEYLQGERLLPFIRAKGEEWIGIMAVQLLADLDRLHQAGWVFGDLKPDNLIVGGPPPRVRWLDVGGTTGMGRSVKEYTEFFDRGYWGLGSRKAEPSYDLFAVGMIMINCAYPGRFNKEGEGHEQLRDILYENAMLERYRGVITSALEGNFTDAPSMRREMVAAMSMQSRRLPQTRKSARHSKRKSKKGREWLEAFFLAAFLFAGYVLYVCGAF